MGMTSFYTTAEPLKESDMVDLIGEAIDQGVNFFDTAYIYGEGKNEIILGQVTK